MYSSYYIALTRTMLEKAVASLVNAQEYSYKSSCENSPEKIQRMINSVRAEIDRLGRYLPDAE